MSEIPVAELAEGVSSTTRGTVSHLSAQLQSHHTQIAILDFGSQYSHLIARRVREMNVFCELYSCEVRAEVLAVNSIAGIILSGGPSSVYDPLSPHVHDSVWKLIEERNLPVLGICYGMQELAHHFGGTVAPSLEREFGRATMHRSPVPQEMTDFADMLFKDVLDKEDMDAGTGAVMWMSHGDKVTVLPQGFQRLAHTMNSDIAVIGNPATRTLGLQFHPEVTHSPKGKTLLRNFVIGLCGAPTDWNMASVAEEFITDVRLKVGETGHVIGAVSGGVDSSVAAVLMHKAIGERFHAVMVDNGCLRKNESSKVISRLKDHMGINLSVIDASATFLAALAGVVEPEKKRKIIGGLFIDVFQAEAKRIEAGLPEGHKVDYLLQGTLYPDVIESISYKGPSATIKTHHNVGGLPATMHLKLIEPLRELFKDEVRTLGIALGIDEVSVWRHPFPGPGLGIMYSYI